MPHMHTGTKSEPLSNPEPLSRSEKSESILDGVHVGPAISSSDVPVCLDCLFLWPESKSRSRSKLKLVLPLLEAGVDA